MTLALAAAVLFGAIPLPVSAQAPGDFLLKRPSGTFTFRAGYADPGEGSEIFAFTREELTVDEGAFSGFVFGVDLAYRLSERLDLSVGLEHSRRTQDSEFRDWVGTDDLPIRQTTRFSRTPFTVGVRAYLKERGRSLSQFVWIPNEWTPYVGAGLGITRYTFEQFGEFVDFETFDIFEDDFLSSGNAFTFNALGGLEVPVGPRFGVVGEVKYSHAKAGMSRDFVEFDDIDLSGTQLTLGVLVRF